MSTGTRHPDDPRLVRDQFRRVYPHLIVGPSHVNIAVIASGNAHAWRPASWHRPLDRWWEGDRPLGPPPVAERWATSRPGTAPLARPRPPLPPQYRPEPIGPTPEQLAQFNAASRARAAAGFREPWERES